MLSVVKLLLKREVGVCALNSHGNYIVDRGKSWKNHGIVVLKFCGNPGCDFADAQADLSLLLAHMSCVVILWRNIRISHEYEGRIEKSVLRFTVWQHKACGVMKNGDLRDRFFYPTLTRIMDYLSCSPFFFYFKISFQKSLNMLRINFT